MNRKQHQKRSLYRRQSGRCHWCNAGMILTHTQLPKGVHPPLRLATIDHLDSRYSPERGKHPGEFRRVLACWVCNKSRNDTEQATIPRRRLWALSGKVCAYA